MKYRTYGSEAEYEPKAQDHVLKNKLHIKTLSEMNQAENRLLLRMYESLFEPEFQVSHLSNAVLMHWHYQWLGPLYDWAGQLRTVHMSKDAFPFASAHLLATLLHQYEQQFLRHYPRLPTYSLHELWAYLAQSHVEFILIHPFREGNGRLGRLLLDVMATQAGFTPLDYSWWDQNKAYYVGAIHAGLMGDYTPMQRLIKDIWPAIS
ncbi:Fic/DOC family protein [Paenalcaligenes hominis]|uniref:Fic/DOC family protein n=1 Tax=Paenalcaligenes hominis TaxID=643674 RepID=UPI003523C78D